MARNKLTYCKKNWLDIAIILLPFIGFLRPLRMVRTSQLARMSQLGRTYTLRVLGTRLIQHVMLMAAVRRLLYRAPEKELQKWHVLLTEKEEEVQEIKQKIAQIEQEIATQPIKPSLATTVVRLPCRPDDDVIG